MKNYTHKSYFEDLDEYEGLNEEEQAWIKQFYLENYMDVGSNKILKSPDMLKSATRLNNSSKRDALFVSERKGALVGLDKTKDKVNLDDKNWITAYKIGGYELAAKTIINNTKESIELDSVKIIKYLLNMLEDFRKLKNVYRKDKREKGQFK